MRTLATLAFVALASTLVGCSVEIPDSAYATPPVQYVEDLPNCSSVNVSPSFWAEPQDPYAASDDNSQYIVLEGNDPVCVTTFQGLELLASRVDPTIPKPASNPMPGSPLASPDSNPMPGAPVSQPASNPMPGVIGHSVRIAIGINGNN